MTLPYNPCNKTAISDSIQYTADAHTHTPTQMHNTSRKRSHMTKIQWCGNDMITKAPHTHTPSTAIRRIHKTRKSTRQHDNKKCTEAKGNIGWKEIDTCSQHTHTTHTCQQTEKERVNSIRGTCIWYSFTPFDCRFVVVLYTPLPTFYHFKPIWFLEIKIKKKQLSKKGTTWTHRGISLSVSSPFSFYI